MYLSIYLSAIVWEGGGSSKKVNRGARHEKVVGRLGGKGDDIYLGGRHASCVFLRGYLFERERASHFSLRLVIEVAVCPSPGKIHNFLAWSCYADRDTYLLIRLKYVRKLDVLRGIHDMYISLFDLYTTLVPKIGVTRRESEREECGKSGLDN